MNLEIKNFIKFVTEKMKEEPKFFMFREEEPIATQNDIENIENIIMSELPLSFTEFQKNFGGGGFAFVELFSLCPSSDFYVLNELNNHSYFPENFFPISSDETGGYYGYIVQDNKIEDEVFYFDTDLRNSIPTKTKWNFIKYFYWSAFKIS